MEWWIYPLLVMAGFIAGFVNTLAGGGSVVSLAVLGLAGFPIDVANGTNRVAILFQTGTGAWRFRKQGKLDIRPNIGIILAAVFGGVIGAFIAGEVSNVILCRSIGICMALMLIPLYLKPSRWLEDAHKTSDGKSRLLQIPFFFLIGLYGGYVQLGVGVFLLMALVLIAGLDLVRGNALKLFIVFCYTVPALMVYVKNGLVRWDCGLTLAVGSILGTWAATHEAAQRGAPFIRRLLIGVVIVASIRYIFF